ncbi:ubiquinone/menaquinone biosynthesis C-methyltransferase UbiE-like [Mya arenaria]|uniref:ubiquinone/menaquinone biosynthesis C-methyltransferase UbiE-like n=1 Tax=Mya arenaria TaxID=6604 RepID=UPI0022E7E208|nr:ubiquinone/menaquinone biosynthesis C-methyltransferase UbiE-like [Mya arenaria]
MGCCSSSASAGVISKEQLHGAAAQLCGIQPSHFVLELSFSKGLGLKQALSLIKGGTGRVVGTETSKLNISAVTRELCEDIELGALEVCLQDSELLPFIHNMFDVIYTVNGNLTWADQTAALKEIYRVLRPGCLFMTCVYKEPVVTKKKQSKQIQIEREFHSDEYVQDLKESGFTKVKIKEHRNAVSGYKYLAVYAYARQMK